MQPIERYGLITLLFLVVSAVAFAMWDAEGAPEDRAGVAVVRGPEAPTGDGSSLSSTPTKRGAKGGADSRNAGVQTAGLGVTGANRRSNSSRPERALGASAPLAGAPDPAQDARRRSQADLKASDQADDWAEDAERNDQNTALRQRQVTTALLAKQRADAERERNAAERREAEELLSSTVQTPTAPSAETYTVKSGDTAGQIAQNLYGTVKALALIEAVNPGGLDMIREGQKLMLPSQKAVRDAQLRWGALSAGTAAADEPQPVQPAPEPEAAATGNNYRVRSGDSLWKIAAQQLGDGNRYTEILAVNPTLNPDRILEGTLILLPSGAAAPLPSSEQPAAETTGNRVR